MDALARIGPWVLLVLGSAAVTGAGWATLARPQTRRLLSMWVFGVLLLGLGVFGQGFLGEYTRFVRVIVRMEEEPSERTYQAFLDAMAAGDVPPALQEVGTAVMLRDPIPELEAMLASAEQETEETDARDRLRAARDELAADRQQAELATRQLRDGVLEKELLFRLPRGVRAHVAEDLERAGGHPLGPEDLRRLGER